MNVPVGFKFVLLISKIFKFVKGRIDSFENFWFPYKSNWVKVVNFWIHSSVMLVQFPQRMSDLRSNASIQKEIRDKRKENNKIKGRKVVVKESTY